MFIKKINLRSGIIHTEEQTTEHQKNSIFLVAYKVPKNVGEDLVSIWLNCSFERISKNGFYQKLMNLDHEACTEKRDRMTGAKE